MAQQELRDYLENLHGATQSLHDTAATLKEQKQNDLRAQMLQDLPGHLQKLGINPEGSQMLSQMGVANPDLFAKAIEPVLTKRIVPDASKMAQSPEMLTQQYGSVLKPEHIKAAGGIKTREEQDKYISNMLSVKRDENRLGSADKNLQAREISTLWKPAVSTMNAEVEKHEADKEQAQNMHELLNKGEKPSAPLMTAAIRLIARNLGKEGARISDQEMGRYIQNNLGMTEQQAMNFVTGGDTTGLSDKQIQTFNGLVKNAIDNNDKVIPQIKARHLNNFAAQYSANLDGNSKLAANLAATAQKEGLEYDPETGRISTPTHKQTVSAQDPYQAAMIAASKIPDENAKRAALSYIQAQRTASPNAVQPDAAAKFKAIGAQ